MAVNSDKTHLWKADVAQSIDFYNDWFLRFAPDTYRKQRIIRTKEVLDTFEKTLNLSQITPAVLKDNPGILPILRMVTAPPLARDRLIGLAHLNKAMVGAMEGSDERVPRLPVRMDKTALTAGLQSICEIIMELADRDLLTWLVSGEEPSDSERDRAATVIADRLCGATADPIIRNAQEKRQLASLKRWLRRKGYKEIETAKARDIATMPAGTFTFRLNVPAGKKKSLVNIPIDCVVKPQHGSEGELPLLIEAKSAGDSTNTNKRRKEEAQKFAQLKERYGRHVEFILLLCGYFEPGYLGYEASEGIDWVWEHRLDDLNGFLSKDKKKTSSIKEINPVHESARLDVSEEERFKFQLSVDEKKSREERNILGQFSTPYPLACQIVSSSLAELPQAQPVSFLEPALGSGVFYSALMREIGDRQLREAVGVERDGAYARIAIQLFKDKKLDVLIQDYFEFTRATENRTRFNLLCTNPPYVRHHHIDPALKQELQSLVRSNLGLNASGLSGLYIYFILLSDPLLAKDAIASWLIPSEFLYVNYGQPLREYLSKHVTLLNIHQFNPESVQFEDALVSSCIVTYRKSRPEGTTLFNFSFGGNVSHPEEEKVVDLCGRDSVQKWTLLHFEQDETALQDQFTIDDFFMVRRGIATGANEYFIISRNLIEKYSIPWQFLKPILPSPRYLTQDIIEAKPDGSPNIENYKYLLDCNLPPSVVRARFSGLWSYFQKGRKEGIHEHYLCANKEVWYFQEKRAPSPFMVTYMGRTNGDSKAPIRFILNYSQAITTNVFLHLYPKPALMTLLNAEPQRMKELFAILNAISSEEFLRVGRAYGGGLHKVEPGELKNLPLGRIPDWMKEIVSKQMVLI